MHIYKRLIGYVKPFRSRLILAAGFTFLYTLTHSLVSVTVFIVLNGMQNKDHVAFPGFPEIPWLKDLHLPVFPSSTIQFSTQFVPLIVVLVFLLRGFFSYLSEYQMATVGLRAIRKLRDDLYAHLVRLSMDFYGKKRVGELMSRTVHDVAAIQSGITEVLVDLFKQPLVILIQIPIVFFWGGPTALIALVSFPVVLIPIVMLGRRLRKTQRKIHEQVANIHSAMQETFSGMSVVKAFNMEDYEVRKFQGINKRVFDFLKRAVGITTIQRPVVEVLGAVGIAFSIWYGIKVLPLDRFASFLTTLFLFYEPIKKLSKVNSVIQQAVASGARIFELMDEVPLVQNFSNLLPLGRDIRSIRFREVSFEYEQGKRVLEKIDFQVRQGEVAAIVGTSGAGKTSLVNLIPRFYDCQEGAVEINGTDIRKFDLYSLREKTGIVTQETFLFNTTVWENIAYGRLDAPFEKVREAAETAFADEFIQELPLKYSTVIGERGVKLSGGQRQRLAIARAILKDPPILILDEATSHLDTESERQVQKAMERLMAGRTVFVIAHRLSTVQNANRILVLESGRVVQSGTNESLLREGGIYKRLYDLQFHL